MIRTSIAWTALLVLVALSIPTSAMAGDAEAGKALFVQNCGSCHGEGGKGDGPTGLAITPKPRDFTIAEFKFDTDGDGTPGTDADLTAIIKNGAMKYGGSPLMAPLPHLSDENVTDIIVFIRTLKQ